MSAARSCVPCRAAKTKCDLARPTCGRCTQRGLNCSGLPADSIFIFRDENEVARRNSQRARRQQRHTPVAMAPSPTETIQQSHQLQAGATRLADLLQPQSSWYNQRAIAEVPAPLRRDVETRAVERFFVNWTLHPSNHASAGHMHDLPSLFQGAQPDSALYLAVRAVAFADMKNESAEGVPFYIKARQQYGATLNRVRAMVNNRDDLGSDQVLSAMLLIDNFELVYLARKDPVGAHSQAIRHVLRSRDETHFYSPSRFSLWCVAHYRLQSWQTLLRERPDAQQIAWVSKLNLERPDLRICGYVLHMNILSALAKILTQTAESDESMRIQKINEANRLAQEIQDLAATVESWTSEMTRIWNTKFEDPQSIARPQDVDESPNFPIPRFPYPHLISYDDLWLAYIWNFYAASQIVLRESLVDVINYIATIQGQGEPDEDGKPITQKQRDWVDVLSNAIIGSFPMLLGFTVRHEQIERPQLPRQGRMAGRLFALFSMWAIQRANFTSAQHKQTAAEVVDWINSRHGLG
ncbi:hypothetical protein GQ53DRAFT_676167 [Thozetella sp. PMI_491]|nr:hypothetical protein GQ53DRAFT_676167 [Thozetella sp. PMI_491]